MMGLHNLWMLAGLAGVAIPIVIHLLSRRRFEVIDWGAMQFLQVSETTRRRLFLEELLLLLLRMGLIAILVLALASPFVDSSALARVGGRANRDVVLIFDGSYSMGHLENGDRSAHDAAREWAKNFLDKLIAGDAVAVLQAKQQVVPVLAEPSRDLDRVRDRIANLPAPRGGCDWPLALQEAHKILGKSQRRDREIILLTDNQRFGWADDNTLLRWELLAGQLKKEEAPPRTWVVNLAPDRTDKTPNWTLAPLRASRAVAAVGQKLTFRTALEIRGQDEYRQPYRVRLEVDGKQVTDLATPTTAKLEKGQVPLSFAHRFTTAGSHLVSLTVEPDPPEGRRPPGYQVKDRLPGDNRQDLAVEVLPALPVLLVDGDARPEVKRRGTDFLRDALAPSRDPAPACVVRVVSVEQFEPALLAQDVGTDKGSKPRVLVLANVPRLSAPQQEAVAQFLGNGGGVLVTLGDRAEPAYYNEQLYRGGEGWLPARLDEAQGDESTLANAPAPLPSTFFHPALDLFRDVPIGGLGDARFPRWWKVTTAGKQSPSTPVALMTNNDPFLVERAYRAGRVLLCVVPLDNGWRTNLPDLPAFAPLAHELVYYLAGARSADNNLQPGQPIRYRADKEESLNGLMLQPPEGEAKPLLVDAAGNPAVFSAQVVRQPQGVLLVHEGVRETGVYQLKTAEDKTIYYVVQPDPRESDLTPSNDGDREKVAKLIPELKYEDRLESMTAALSESSQRYEFWGWFLLAVIAFLCCEVWMTRRIVRGR
jgi:hypothetical protein